MIDAVRKLKIPVYNEETGEGILRHIVTRVSYATGDIMVILVVTKENVPGLDRLIRRLTDEVPQVKSIVLNINKRRDNVILGDTVKTVYGSYTLVDRLGHLTFHISPLSFYQVNPVQTVVLYEKAVEFAGLTGSETVFDLYCGIGTISLFLAKKAGRVIGVEVVPEAVEAATKNAKVNNIFNAEFFCGAAEEVVPRSSRRDEGRCGCSGPARKGAMRHSLRRW